MEKIFIELCWDHFIPYIHLKDLKTKKDEFIKSVIDTFDDNSIRFFVLEVNSSEEDLQSIICDLLKHNIKFNFDD